MFNNIRTNNIWDNNNKNQLNKMYYLKYILIMIGINVQCKMKAH